MDGHRCPRPPNGGSEKVTPTNNKIGITRFTTSQYAWSIGLPVMVG